MGVYDVEVEVKLNKDGFEGDLKSVGQETQKAGNEINARTIAIGNVIANLATKAGQFFVESAKKGLEVNKQLQSYTMALATALGSEEKAAAAIEQIKQDAARTPYSIDGLVAANQYLISAGESAESARDTIMALGDAVSATGGGNEELQRMAQNLQQIKNVGKATSMDIRQFAMAGINIYGLLADYTGKTTAEVQDLDITYDMLTGALQHASEEGGRYYEAMIKQSKTLGGQWNTLKDNVDQKLGEAFESVAQILTETVLPAANELITSLDIGKVSEGFKQFAVNIAALVGPIVAVEGATKLAATATKLWNTVLAESPYLAVAAAIGVVVAATADYSQTVDNMVKKEREFNGTAEEAAARLKALIDERIQLKDAIDNGATEATLIDRYNTLDLLIPAAREAFLRLSAAEAETSENADAVGDGLEGVAEVSEETTEALNQLIAEHNKLNQRIRNSVSGWYGLFDNASSKVKASVKDMMKAMQSQIDFNNNYSKNLDYLAQNGLGALGTAFQGMGKEGAAYADALVKAIEKAGGASSEGGQKVINDFMELANGVDKSQENLSTSLTNITGTLEDKLSEWEKTAKDSASALDASEEASAAGKATVDAYITSIEGGAKGALAAAVAVAKAAAKGLSSGSGSGSGDGGNSVPEFATGADYIPYDNFPALLHKGEMVIPAKVSSELRDFIGASGRTSSSGPITQSRGSDSRGLEEIVSLLEAIVHNGLTANIGRSQIYKTVRDENRIRTKSTNYNALGATA